METTEVRRISLGDIKKVVTPEEQKAKMSFVTGGIIKDVTEGITKDGKPFVIASILDKETTLSIRMFDTSLSSFLKKYEITSGISYPVEVLVNYAEEYGLTLKKMAVLPFERGTDYINKSLVPAGDNLVCINGAIGGIVTEELKTLVDRVMGFNPVTMGYYPYSNSVHTENGGYLQAIANMLNRLNTARGIMTVSPEGDYVPLVDIEVLTTAIICHNLGWLAFARADQFGLIVDAGELPFGIYGGPEAVSRLMVYSLIREIMAGKPTSNKAMNVIHCLGCIDGTVCEPATIEGKVFKNLVIAERSEYLASVLTKNLEVGETLKNRGTYFTKL